MLKKGKVTISIILIFFFNGAFFTQSNNAYAKTSNEYTLIRIDSEIACSKIKDLYYSGKYTNNLILKGKPMVNGIQYYTIELKNLKLDNNYNLIPCSGVNRIFVDSNWKLVSDPEIIEKLQVIWKANVLYYVYYQDIARHNGVNYLVSACEENKSNRDQYLSSKAVRDACAEISSSLITGGTKVATKELLKEAAKDLASDYLLDAKKWADAFAQLSVSSLLYQYEQYARGLDKFYWKLQDEGKNEIVNYEEACYYIDLTYQAANVINLITLQMELDGRSDCPTDMLSYIKEYAEDIGDGIVSLIYEKNEKWINVELSNHIDTLKKIREALDNGEDIEAVKNLSKLSNSFNDFLT